MNAFLFKPEALAKQIGLKGRKHTLLGGRQPGKGIPYGRRLPVPERVISEQSWLIH